MSCLEHPDQESIERIAQAIERAAQQSLPELRQSLMEAAAMRITRRNLKKCPAGAEPLVLERTIERTVERTIERASACAQNSVGER